MRALLIAVIAFSAAPALAQTCKITREADGLTTIGQVTVTGTTASDLMLDTGPFQADIKFDPKAKGYTVAKGEKASLYLFRTGKSAEGADWRTPGSMETGDAGFAFELPHVLLNGMPVEKLLVTVATAEISDAWSWTQAQSRKREGAALVDLTAEVKVPDHGFETLFYGADEEEAFFIWYDWRDELLKREPVNIKITDPKTSAVIAELSFPQPTQEAMQARLVGDVTALRQAVAENRCEKS